MQDFANDKRGSARLARKRLERKSSLEELRNMKELTHKQSTEDPEEVSVVHNLLETSPCSDPLKESFGDVERHSCLTNRYLQRPGKELRRTVQARTDINGTFVDGEVRGRNYFDVAASTPESALLMNQLMAAMGQHNNRWDSMGLQWMPGTNGEMPGGTLHPMERQ